MMPRAGSHDFRGSGGSGGGSGICPPVIAQYMSLHMDSIVKVLNHVLALVLLLNILLFLASFGVSFLPSIGFSTTLIAMLLIAQCITVWLVINNTSSSNHNPHNAVMRSRSLDFKIGLAFGLTVGAVILSFLVSHAFRNPTFLCNPYFPNAAAAAGTRTNNNNNGDNGGGGSRLLVRNRGSVHTQPLQAQQIQQQQAQQQQQQQQQQQAQSSGSSSITAETPLLGDATPSGSTNETSSSSSQQQQAGGGGDETQEEEDDNNQQQQQDQSSSVKIYVPAEERNATSEITIAPMEYTILCSQRKGNMVAVWFWAGLSFWCNFACCLLLWVGHSELLSSSAPGSSSQGPYDAVDGGGGSAFVGDYATVPEIRNGGGGGGSGPTSSSSASVMSSQATTGYGPSMGGYSDHPVGNMTRV